MDSEKEAFETLDRYPEMVDTPLRCSRIEVGHRRLGKGTTAIIAASKGRNDGLVTKLAIRGADLTLRDKAGRDALWWAASSGRIDTVRVLVDNGCDPNTKANNKWTALQIAAAWDHLAVCLFLISRGADLRDLQATRCEIDVTLKDTYGSFVLGIDPGVIKDRRALLEKAFERGPHPSQVLRRWSNRWPFMSAITGSGFRRLRAQRVEMEQRKISAVTESSGGKPVDGPLAWRDQCVSIVFSAENLVRLIASYL